MLTFYEYALLLKLDLPQYGLGDIYNMICAGSVILPTPPPYISALCTQEGWLF